MSHIRTVSSAKLSGNSNLNGKDRNNEELLRRIKADNSKIFKNLSLLEGEERALTTSKTQQIQRLAANYEKLAALGEYQEPISHICATIVRQCVEKELHASAQLTRLVLDKKYKQTEYTSHNNLEVQQQQQEGPSVEPNSENSIYDHIARPESNSFYQSDNRLANVMNNSSLGMDNGKSVYVDPISSVLYAQDKPLEELSRDELRMLAESRVARTRKSRESLLEDRRREREVLAECDKRKVALSPEYEQTPQNHISAKSPDSGPSPAWESCIELIESYKKLAAKLWRWRPPKEIQDAMVEAFEADIEFLEPFLDEKYRKCQPAWWVVQLNNLWHGKHAAAIMSSTPIDEKFRRALTREQVGDRAQEDLKRAIRFSAAIKKWAMLWTWFVKMNEKGIATRAKELGPTLSDKAFS